METSLRRSMQNVSLVPTIMKEMDNTSLRRMKTVINSAMCLFYSHLMMGNFNSPVGAVQVLFFFPNLDSE